MVAEIHQLKQKPSAIRWMCSSCGEDASCNCGAPLMSKNQRAVEAIAANPRMSDRAIANEIGVGKDTVRRARDETGAYAPVDDDPRIGLDGKARRMPTRPETTEDSPKEIRKAFLFYAYEAKLLARYDGPIDDEVISSATATSAAWRQLISSMKGNTHD